MGFTESINDGLSQLIPIQTCVKGSVNPGVFVFTQISDFCTILNMNMCSIITNKDYPLQTNLSWIFCRFKTAILTILSRKKHMVLTAGI